MDQNLEIEQIRRRRRLRRSRRANHTSTIKWLWARQVAGPPGPAQRAAFVSLYREYYPEVCAGLQKFGAPADTAAEVTQQFFYQLFDDAQRLSVLDPAIGSLPGWLKRYARFDYLKHLKQMRRFDTMGSELDDWRSPSGALLESWAQSPEQLLHLARRQFIVRRVYRRLQRRHTKPHKEVILRELYLDLSENARETTDAELASRFGLREDAIRGQRRRIRKEFKAHLEREQQHWIPDSNRDPS